MMLFGVSSAMDKGDRAWTRHVNGKVQNTEDIYMKMINHPTGRYNQFYNDISNPLLWFIQHQLWDIPRNPSINQETWEAWEHGYVPINKAFAEAIAEAVQDANRPVIILPQDYHLYLVPKYLRELLGWDVQIQPFVQYPLAGARRLANFTPAPSETTSFYALLASNRIGFQTKKDAS